MRRRTWLGTSFALVVGQGLAVAPLVGAQDGGGGGGGAPRPDAAVSAVVPAVIGGDSMCPRPDEVWASLGTLLPAEGLEERIRAQLPGAPPVTVVDLGAGHRVVIGGRAREYQDEARDCVQRAHVTAVFVALTLGGTEPSPAPAETAPPPPPSPPANVPASRTARRTRIEMGAVVDAGVGGDFRPVFGGAALRAVVGRSRLAFVAGVEALLPRQSEVGGVSMSHGRLPIDAGLRARLGTAPLDLFGEAGVAVTAVWGRAASLASAGGGQPAVELGARAAVGLSFTSAGRLGLFLALHAQVVPFPATFSALPRGEIGRSPPLWAGATAGASVEF